MTFYISSYFFFGIYPLRAIRLRNLNLVIFFHSNHSNGTVRTGNDNDIGVLSVHCLLNAILFIFDMSRWYCVFFFCSLALRYTQVLLCVEFVFYSRYFVCFATFGTCLVVHNKATAVAPHTKIKQKQKQNKARQINATHRFMWIQDKIKIDAAITIFCTSHTWVCVCALWAVGCNENTASFCWPWNQRHLLIRFIKKLFFPSSSSSLAQAFFYNLLLLSLTMAWSLIFGYPSWCRLLLISAKHRTIQIGTNWITF